MRTRHPRLLSHEFCKARQKDCLAAFFYLVRGPPAGHLHGGAFFRAHPMQHDIFDVAVPGEEDVGVRDDAAVMLKSVGGCVKRPPKR